MNQFIKGYKRDAAVDIVLDQKLDIEPGFNTIELPAQYTPADGEVAFLLSRGSTAAKGIFPIGVAIDPGYSGKITAWCYNMSGFKHTFNKGDRVFSVVNLKLGEDRVDYAVAKEGERGTKKLASSGGQTFEQLQLDLGGTD